MFRSTGPVNKKVKLRRGPFWRTKDNGAWSIPKGEIDAADAPEQVARREFAETRPECFDWSTPGAGGDPTARREARSAFAGEGHFDPAALTSNTFDIEWPSVNAVSRRSTRRRLHWTRPSKSTRSG
ncbi:NUDIX domain-containing protein [Bradyrhizobium sp. JR4.1]|uniref:NUDIX domain-containing protein n=1 Tax=Bradyrhizobium sp. JR4.1 TaxID=3156372 RepID=UPI003397B41A